MKKFFKIFGLVLLILLIAGIIYINMALPALPENSEDLIENAIHSQLIELKGNEGFAYNDSTKIWYESITPKDSVKGTILLIMGISNDALAWPRYFLDPLVENGYRVIRFDNRGTGMSDWFEDWTEEDTYSLEDIGNDGIAILDHLNIETTHVIGVSLGGMIAQSMAIHHPGRVETLTSMMSTGNIMDEELPSINTDLIQYLVMAQVKYGLIKTETNQIKLQILARQLLQGEKKYELDIEGVAQSTLYNIRKRKGENPEAFRQQSAAVMKSGSRYKDLKKLTLPSLIIHGTSDPLINFKHGKKCFDLIPGAKKLWLEGMGHDIPKVVVDEVIQTIIQHIESNE